MKKVRFEKWQLIVLSVFYIVFGIISAAVPREQFLTFFHILGLIIMLIGAFSIFIYFLRRDYLQEHNFQVTFGVLYIMAGMIVWMKPGTDRFQLSFCLCRLCGDRQCDPDAVCNESVSDERSGLAVGIDQCAAGGPAFGCDPCRVTGARLAENFADHPVVSGRGKQSADADLWKNRFEALLPQGRCASGRAG